MVMRAGHRILVLMLAYGKVALLGKVCVLQCQCPSHKDGAEV